MKFINWVQLLACPAVLTEKTVLVEPAEARTIESVIMGFFRRSVGMDVRSGGAVVSTRAKPVAIPDR